VGTEWAEVKPAKRHHIITLDEALTYCSVAYGLLNQLHIDPSNKANTRRAERDCSVVKACYTLAHPVYYLQIVHMEHKPKNKELKR